MFSRVVLKSRRISLWPNRGPSRRHLVSARLLGAAGMFIVVGLTDVAMTHRGVDASPSSISLDEAFTGSTLADPSKWIALRGGTALEWPCLTGRSQADGQLSVLVGSIQSCANQGGPVSNVGEGVLRLTRHRPLGENPLLSGASAMQYNDALSASEGIDISFSIRMGATNAADGINFFLKDGSNSVNTVGAPGGALGYGVYSGAAGVPGGLLGVGFDAFGSYSWDGISTSPACDGRRGAIRSLPTLAQAKSSIVLRGPDLSANKDGTAGYCYLDGADVTYADAQFQRVRVKVEPYTPGVATTVSVYLAPHANPTLLPIAPTITGQVTLTAATFKFGFAASTGYWSNDHEVRGLVIRPAGPVVTALASTAATGSGTGPTSGGTTLTITGSNIDPGASVTIDGQPCTNVAVTAGGTQLTCETPAGSLGTKQVVVTNPNGGPAFGSFTYVNPAPTVTAVNPSSGVPTGGGTVTLTGTGFISGATVTFGGQSCGSVNVVSSTSLSCVVPAGTDGSTVDVVVTNLGPVSGTGAGLYAYRAAPPTTTTIASSEIASVSSSESVSVLPATGGSTSRMVVSGFVMVVFAGAVFAIRRRMALGLR